jgi:hypothetical protein
VESVSRQVVAGILYTVEFELGTTLCAKNDLKLTHEKLHHCQLKEGEFVSFIWGSILDRVGCCAVC